MTRIIVCLLALVLSLQAKASETWAFQTVALVPSQAWETAGGAPNGAVFEPKVLPRTSCVILAAPCLGMWYSGGWGTCAAGYAETADLTGKTGWTKYTKNPIIGGGALGQATACRKNVYYENGTYWVYFQSQSTNVLYVTSSADGVTNLSAPAQVLTDVVNSFVWKEGSIYHMLYDFGVSTAPYAVYQTYGAVAAAPGGPWSKLNNGQSLPAFQTGGGATSYAPAIVLNGVRNYWTHQEPIGEWLPSDIFHGCEPVTASGILTVANDGLPIITHRVAENFDQVADMWPIDLQGIGTIFADEDNNKVNSSAPYAQISVWTASGPLASLSCP